jgi:hypothetical protein
MQRAAPWSVVGAGVRRMDRLTTGMAVVAFPCGPGHLGRRPSDRGSEWVGGEAEVEDQGLEVGAIEEWGPGFVL